MPQARGGAILALHIACAIEAAAGGRPRRLDVRLRWDGCGAHAAVEMVQRLLPALLRFVGTAAALVEFLRRMPLIGVAVD